MDRFPSGYNMPPGCFESDIPGNRPDDVLHEKASEEAADRIAEICAESQEACEFALVCRDDNDFCMCQKLITRMSDDNKIVAFGRGGGDPADCPFIEQTIERIFSDLKDGIDPLGDY